MAGHSQFKNIMHRKGKVDAVRSKVFSKLAREITVAAKMGMPDPAMNPRLRAAILAARAENMPKDNIQRAINKASDIRSYFTKSGGNLAETGAVSFMFDRVGYIEFGPEVANADAMLDAAIDAGADDVASSETGHEVYCDQGTLNEVTKALEDKFGEPKASKLVWKPQTPVAVDDETGEKLMKLMESLEEHDDVQNVYGNFELSDALMQKMAG